MVELFVKVFNKKLLSRVKVQYYGTTKNCVRNLMHLPVSAFNSLQLLALLAKLFL